MNLKVVLLGLPHDIADSLGHFISRWGLTLYIPQQVPNLQTLRLLNDSTPDLVFVWTGGTQGTSLLEAVKMSNAQVPTIAVSRLFKSIEVLDALDSGAIDYCIPPFDPTHIQRLLEIIEKPVCSC